MDDLLLSSYYFDLPKELIADRPSDNSRLLVYDRQTQKITHDYFKNIANFLPKESLLVFNQSKVFPSRLIGTKSTGGKAEIFFLSVQENFGMYPCLIKTRSKKKINDIFLFQNNLKAILKEIKEDGTFLVSIENNPLSTLEEYLNQFAKIPIPPYIRNGESDERDVVDYQTVFAKTTGSVAAPTAGLHFKKNILDQLDLNRIERAFVTLHVGLGTFRPVTTTHLQDHKMHSENYFVEKNDLEKIKNAKVLGKKVFAVGTTSLRVLESSLNLTIDPFQIYQTDIFLHPGKEVKSVDGLITNFHLPESTLLMLVSTLIGREKTLEIYREAIEEKYKFFSYGDGMLIL